MIVEAWVTPRSPGQSPAELNETTSIFITKKIRFYLSKAILAGVALCGHPLNWNKTLQRLEMGSRRQQNFWRFNMTLAFSHLVFVYIRCIQIELKLIPVSKYQLIYVRSMGVFYSLGAILHFGVIYKKTDIVQFLNQVMETIQNFERKNVGGSTKTPKIITDIELVMQMVKYSFGGAWLVFTILVSVRPHSQDQISSLFLDEDSQGWLYLIVSILNGIFMAHIIYVFYASGSLIVQTFLAITPNLAVLEEIQGLARSIDSKGSKNKSTLLVCTCRWFCMYVDIACEIYTEVVLPVAQILLIVSVVFCTYGAVKMEGIPSLGLGLLGLFAFGFLTVLFTLMTEVHDRASAAKLYWKGCGIADPWLRRALQAMPVKSLKLAGTYIIDRQIVLTMVDVILSQTVTFLLVNP